jgi:hypothetical protein
MLSFKLTFEPPLQNLSDAFKRVNISEIMRPVIQEFAFAVERYSKQVTPVDTGRLRASIGVSAGFGGGMRTFVQPNVFYAGYVHEGTRRMRGRPFMRWGTEFALGKLTGGELAWKLEKSLVDKLVKL